MPNRCSAPLPRRTRAEVDTGLRGKTAIVGGGSQGIGYVVAHMLAMEGANVAIVARREERLREAAARIQQDTGSPVHAIPADIRCASLL